MSQTRPACVHHDVLRLQIAMDHAFGVRRFQAQANLLEDRHHFVGRQVFPFHQDALQIPPFDVIHRDELASIGAAEIEDPDDVLVGDLPGENQLLFEAAENIGMAGQLRADHLEGYQPVQLMIARLVHRAHAALAQPLQDFVALAENYRPLPREHSGLEAAVR